jgi:MYXO-CTERM domain-containing protein
MCCFSSKTEVHGTRIFARLTPEGTQMLAYQMLYSAVAPTAMILPLPVALPADDTSVRWKSLKDYDSLFQDLDAGFPAEPPPQSLFGSRSKSASAVAAAPLPVHDVGDFVASFVPRIQDFARLDPRFVISGDVWAKIPEYADYGFAVFQLSKLSGTPHPIAFEFRSRLRDVLYFPTVHIHDGTVHAQDAFDHSLYLQDARFDARASGYSGPSAPDRSTGYVRSKSNLASFADVGRGAGLLDGSLLVHRTTMQGMLPNKDTLVSVNVAARSGSTGCGHCAVSPDMTASVSGPASLALLGLSWIIRRRNDRARD